MSLTRVDKINHVVTIVTRSWFSRLNYVSTSFFGFLSICINYHLKYVRLCTFSFTDVMCSKICFRMISHIFQWLVFVRLFVWLCLRFTFRFPWVEYIAEIVLHRANSALGTWVKVSALLQGVDCTNVASVIIVIVMFVSLDDVYVCFQLTMVVSLRFTAVKIFSESI